MIRRRLRGILGITIAACIPWTALGLLVGTILQLNIIPGIFVGLGSPIPGGLVTVGALSGVIIGLVNGLTFSGLILATERGKNLEDLRAWRFAMWGGVATGGTLGLLFHSLWAVGVGGAVGAVAALAALWTARRASGSAAHTPSTTG